MSLPNRALSEPLKDRNQVSMLRQLVAAVSVLMLCTSSGLGAGIYHEVSYPPSQHTNELSLGVTFTLWIPDRVGAIRAVIVHQHGCGTGACQGGATAAHDLHWQALARKWHCALLGPAYRQLDNQDCTLWSNPVNGSERAFLMALDELAAKTGHPELATVPWCLWGHSGGGYWAGEMQLRHPERVVAVWQRSGAARFFREKDPDPILEAALEVPVMCNPGIKEKTDRFARIWEGMVDLARSYRAHGAPASLAPDPRTSHECGESRYLAIPFFDACLEMRLPARTGDKLRPVDMKRAWLAPLLGTNAMPAAKYQGPIEQAIWLPDAKVAKAWVEYVNSGTVRDTTPPAAPFDIRAAANPEGTITIAWDAEADFESGLRGFLIRRDGADLAAIPDKPSARSGRPLFQQLSYHDTPEAPLRQMSFTDLSALPGAKHRYEIIAVNSVGLSSRPARISARAPPRGTALRGLKTAVPARATEKRNL